MRSRSLTVSTALLCAVVVAPVATAQDVPHVDFARDVQPIFRTYCIGCHGPTIHQNGFRLDRRGDAMRGGTLPVIGPGNAEASRLYLRLTGNSMGSQMPPTGALKPEQIALVKAWIDQGAEWPDAVSGEAPPTSPDPLASRMIEALRAGDRAAFRATAREAGTIGTRKGAGGTTPLMQAVIDGTLDDVRLLLDGGADVNARNDAGATALIWAVHDAAKTRLLLEYGADVNAASDNGRTALMNAAGRSGAGPVVRLLLDYGANPSASGSESSVLLEATLVSEQPVVRMLLDAGADAAAAGPIPPIMALKAGCTPCAEWIAAKLPPPVLADAAAVAGAPFGDSREIGFFLDRGANVNAQDSQGRTVLMLATASDVVDMTLLRRLVDAGADVNARTPAGETALMHARLHRNVAAVELLTKAGARDDRPPAVRPQPVAAASPRAAIERSLPVLQESDVTFLKKAGCVSCHNNVLTALTVAAARARGIAVNEEVAARQRSAIATVVESWRERVQQGLGIPGDNDTISYILLGLDAGGYPADGTTDALARFLVRQQLPDGRFRILAHRPPIESSDVEVTAATLRALQRYGPRPDRAVVDSVIARAGNWLRQARPRTNEDRVFRLLGLAWAGAPRAAVDAAARALVAEQRPDGGWSQTAWLTSDAYATGQAVYALMASGALTNTDTAITRGTQYLLSTQLADGSWFVESRSIALQPLFDSGFPHGRNQWISAAGTNWAALALAQTVKKGS